jgi:amino acid adenylation domain-containing protein
MMKDAGISKNNMLTVNRYGKEKEYWLNKLSGEAVKSFFPYDYTGGEKGEPATSAEVKITLPGELFPGLITLATGKDHRLHMILLAVLAALLRKYTGSSVITVGVPIYKQEKHGRFINTALALRHQLPGAGDITFGDITFKELLLQVRQTLREAVDHQNYPMDTLLYQLGLSADQEGFPLFDVVLLLENIHDKSYIRHVKCNMVFSFVRTGGTVAGKVEYNPLCWEKRTLERIAGHFTCLLAAVLAGGIEMPLSDLEIVTPEEKHRLLDEFNGPPVEYPRDTPLSLLFAGQAANAPDSIALIDLCRGQRTETRHITYRELSRSINRLACLLRQKGIGSDTIVALLVEQPLQLIIGMLAAVTAGGAYMPIDPAYPAERMELMIKDSNAPVLLVGSGLSDGIPIPEAPLVMDFDHLDLEQGTDFQSPPDLSPASIAYVLYTSGSTGSPKGVMVENRNVVRLVRNAGYVGFSSAVRILQVGSPVFDALTFEVWGALLNGGQLVLGDREFLLDAGKLADTLRRQHITMLLLTPSFFNQLAQQSSGMFSGLHWLLVGGDVLSPRHIDLVRKANPDLNVVNAYGPTENGTISTAYLIDREWKQSIPIGSPINNSTAHILDINGRLQPIGVAGELCVGGDGVARGYMNNPELTAEKFDRDEKEAKNKQKFFGGSRGAIFQKSPPGRRRHYRTGDLARWLPDGLIEFLGRKDYQVKIRGHRIELSEIENRLLKHPAVKDAIVLLMGGRELPFLCAYFVPGGDVSVPELKNHVKEALPDYMVPTYLIRLEAFPITPTGKIDRKALPDPKSLPREDEDRQPPTNETEETILQTWSQVLGLDPEKISIEDNFFQLGGNSINVLKVQKQLIESFGCDVSISTMFLCPTIKMLANDINRNSQKTELEYAAKINNGKNKKNIFMFHPMHGMIYPYKTLAKLLEDRFNMYGIQAKGLNSEVPLPESYNEMAKEYLVEIKAVQPTGPYILAGYCIGNIVAYETAVELEKQGEQVETLLLVDIGTVAPENPGFFRALRVLFEVGLLFLHLYNKRKSIVIEHKDEEATEEQKHLMDRVWNNNMKLFKRYRYKQIIHSPLIHIRVIENLSMLLFQKSWRKMSTGVVKLFKTPGTHHNILIHPQVDKLAEIIKANIE